MTTATADREIVLERIFDAPREQVFAAWTDAGQFAQWFAPDQFTIPVCDLDPQPGGRMLVVMRGPAGTAFAGDFPMTGTYEEVLPPERIVYVDSALDPADGSPALTCRNTVTFAVAGAGTRLTVSSVVLHATALGVAFAAGMEEGLGQSLNHLADLLRRPQDLEERSIR